MSGTRRNLELSDAVNEQLTEFADRSGMSLSAVCNLGVWLATQLAAEDRQFLLDMIHRGQLPSQPIHVSVATLEPPELDEAFEAYVKARGWTKQRALAVAAAYLMRAAVGDHRDRSWEPETYYSLFYLDPIGMTKDAAASARFMALGLELPQKPITPAAVGAETESAPAAPAVSGNRGPSAPSHAGQPLPLDRLQQQKVEMDAGSPAVERTRGEEAATKRRRRA